MKTIAVTGGKGGVGKTLISVNLAVGLAQTGTRVVLFDADLQLANIDIALDLQPKLNLQHVEAGESTLLEAQTPGPSGLYVITGGSAVQGLMNAGPKRMATFFSQLDSLRRSTDVLIFDTGAGVDQRVMTFLRMSEETIIVTTPDPTSVTDAYATAKILWRRDPGAQVSVLCNMTTSPHDGLTVYSTLRAICEKYLDKTPHYLGSVQADMRAMESVRRRQPLLLWYPESPAAQDITRLARGMAGQLRRHAA